MFYKRMRVLIIGNLYDNHNGRFVMHLRAVRPDSIISFLNICESGMERPGYCNCIDDLIPVVESFPSPFYRLPFFRAIFRMIDQNRSVRSLVKFHKSYDVVNVQYVSVYSVLASRLFHNLSNTVLLTPWGSDVYRVNGALRPFIRGVYNRADYVSLCEGRFRDDCVKYFKIKESKIVNMDIGSDTIDYIKEHNTVITKEMAKERMGFGNAYVIVCGYNASPAQNHQIMIDALSGKVACLPDNYVVVLPMTYSGTKEYKESIRALLNRLDLRYKLYDSYLSVEDLYLLRRSADMFIHIQNTDANSAAIREFLLTDTKVLNGSWLRYKELEKERIPYHIVSSFESLSDDIDVAINTPFSPIPQALRSQLEGYGWDNQIRLWADFFDKNS